VGCATLVCMMCPRTTQWFAKALVAVVLLACTTAAAHAVGHEEAQNAAVAGGEYLLAAIEEDGSFVYERNAIYGRGACRL